MWKEIEKKRQTISYTFTKNENKAVLFDLYNLKENLNTELTFTLPYLAEVTELLVSKLFKTNKSALPLY